MIFWCDCVAATGYFMSFLCIFTIILLIGSTACSNWWLSYWLGQGSGSSVRAPNLSPALVLLWLLSRCATYTYMVTLLSFLSRQESKRKHHRQRKAAFLPAYLWSIGDYHCGSDRRWYLLLHCCRLECCLQTPQHHVQEGNAHNGWPQAFYVPSNVSTFNWRQSCLYHRLLPAPWASSTQRRPAVFSTASPKIKRRWTLCFPCIFTCSCSFQW